MGISVVINTYNEAKNLQECLDSVKGFDEIVVCDMESTDETVEIARRNGCKTIIFPKGSHTICEPARNTAIQSASNPWVLVLDADEKSLPGCAIICMHSLRIPATWQASSSHAKIT